MRGTLLIDGRNFLDPEAAAAAGLAYEGVGRPSCRPPLDRGGRGLMQALILAGGEGTRLRPLTTTVPKPVVPLVDRPFIAFMLDWLRTHGVDDIVISCGHMAAGVRNVLGDGSAFGVRLRYVEEPTPLGTGGALKYAESLLEDRFFMLNGDVLTDIDLSVQLAQHEATGATATLALTPVEDPTNYGLVRCRDDGQVSEFVEKPSYDQIDTRNISAGAYVLERSVLDMLEAEQPASIERDVFPQLVGRASTAAPATTTGSTSGRRSATSRRRSTSSRARSGRPSPSGRATAISSSSSRSRAPGGSSRPRSSRAAAGSPTGRAWAAAWCSSRASRSGRTP